MTRASRVAEPVVAILSTALPRPGRRPRSVGSIRDSTATAYSASTGSDIVRAAAGDPPGT